MSQLDRRQYFRIDQKISLEFRLISKKEIINNNRPTQFDVSPNFLLLSEIQKIDSETSHLLHKIAEKDQNIAALLSNMHNKIERIAQAVASSEMVVSNAAIQEVNLSEGGLQFRHSKAVPLETYLSIKLVFPESCLGLLLYGQCCRNQRMADGYYMTGVEFIKMPESCRTQLARIILESQAARRRKSPHVADSSKES